MNATTNNTTGSYLDTLTGNHPDGYLFMVTLFNTDGSHQTLKGYNLFENAIEIAKEWAENMTRYNLSAVAIYSNRRMDMAWFNGFENMPPARLA